MLLISELKIWKYLLEISNLLLDCQNIAVFKLYSLLLIISNEIRWYVSSVKLKTINILNFMMKCFSLLNCYGAVNTYFVVQVSKHISNLSVSVSRNSGHIWYSLSTSDFSRISLELSSYEFDSLINASLEVRWVNSWFDFLKSLLEDCSS